MSLSVTRRVSKGPRVGNRVTRRASEGRDAHSREILARVEISSSVTRRVSKGPRKGQLSSPTRERGTRRPFAGNPRPRGNQLFGNPTRKRGTTRGQLSNPTRKRGTTLSPQVKVSPDSTLGFSLTHFEVARFLAYAWRAQLFSRCFVRHAKAPRRRVSFFLRVSAPLRETIFLRVDRAFCTFTTPATCSPLLPNNTHPRSGNRQISAARAPARYPRSPAFPRHDLSQQPCRLWQWVVGQSAGTKACRPRARGRSTPRRSRTTPQRPPPRRNQSTAFSERALSITPTPWVARPTRGRPTRIHGRSDKQPRLPRPSTTNTPKHRHTVPTNAPRDEKSDTALRGTRSEPDLLFRGLSLSLR